MDTACLRAVLPRRVGLHKAVMWPIPLQLWLARHHPALRPVCRSPASVCPESSTDESQEHRLAPAGVFAKTTWDPRKVSLKKNGREFGIQLDNFANVFLERTRWSSLMSELNLRAVLSERTRFPCRKGMRGHTGGVHIPWKTLETNRVPVLGGSILHVKVKYFLSLRISIFYLHFPLV